MLRATKNYLLSQRFEIIRLGKMFRHPQTRHGLADLFSVFWQSFHSYTDLSLISHDACVWRSNTGPGSGADVPLLLSLFLKPGPAPATVPDSSALRLCGRGCVKMTQLSCVCKRQK